MELGSECVVQNSGAHCCEYSLSIACFCPQDTGRRQTLLLHLLLQSILLFSLPEILKALDKHYSRLLRRLYSYMLSRGYSLWWFEWEWLTKLIYLSVWVPVGKTVWEGWGHSLVGGGVSLVALRFISKSHARPSLSVCASCLWTRMYVPNYCSSDMPTCHHDPCHDD